MDTYTSQKAKMPKKFTPVFQNPGKTLTGVEVYGVKSSQNRKNAISKNPQKNKKMDANAVCEG